MLWCLLTSGVQIVMYIILSFLRVKNDVTLRVSWPLGVPTVIFAVASGFISSWCLMTEVSATALILSSLFCLLGLVFLYPYCRWRVRYDAEWIELRPCFSRQQLFRMAEVTGVTEGQFTTVLHFQFGKLRLYGPEEKREWLVEEVSHHYRKRHDALALPDVPRRIFPWYIKDSWAQLKMHLIVGLGIIAVVIVVLCLDVARIHVSMDNLTQITVCDYDVQWEDETLHLYSQELSQPYYLSNVESTLSQDQFATLIRSLDATKPLVILVEEDNFKAAQNGECNFIRIQAIARSTSEVLVSHENVMATQWNLSLIGGILGVFLLWWLGFLWLGCYAANHEISHPILYGLFAEPLFGRRDK